MVEVKDGKLERTANAREGRRSQVAKMVRDGWSDRSIAKRLGLSVSTIKRDIREITALVRTLGPEAFAAAKLFARDKLLWIAQEAEAAWRKSQGTIVKRRIKGKTNGRGKISTEQGTDLVIEEYESAGDTRYLDTMRAAVADFRRLLGIDEPERHEHSGPDGQPLTLMALVQDYEQKKPEVIDAEVTKALPAPEEESNEDPVAWRPT